jgi:iron complex transport system ATP-binding protein
MKSPLLYIHQLDIGYQRGKNRFVVQSGLNLNLNGGELICLIGPNGVGKSTLLKTLGRILPPVDGEIAIDGVALHDLSYNEFSKKLGLVLTEQADIPHIKAADIISMGRYPYIGFLGKLTKVDWQIVQEVAKVVGLQDLLQRPYAELSDGEKQKVMIAKALAQKTPLMLLDEPTAFLDFPTKASLLIMLRKLAWEQNIGVILSTHDIELALKTADQLWLFPKHNEMISGCPEDLVLHGDIQRVFQNSDINFNISSGHFEKVFHSDRKVNVRGEGSSAYWLKKALIRNEIQLDDQSEWLVDCAEKFTIYHEQDFVAEVDRIQDVLALLKV